MRTRQILISRQVGSVDRQDNIEPRQMFGESDTILNSNVVNQSNAVNKQPGQRRTNGYEIPLPTLYLIPLGRIINNVCIFISIPNALVISGQWYQVYHLQLAAHPRGSATGSEYSTHQPHQPGEAWNRPFVSINPPRRAGDNAKRIQQQFRYTGSVSCT